MKITVNYDLDLKADLKEQYEKISFEDKMESDDLYFEAQECNRIEDKRVRFNRAIELNQFNSDARLQLLLLEKDKRDIGQDLLDLIDNEHKIQSEIHGISETINKGDLWMIIEGRPLLRMYFHLATYYNQNQSYLKAIKVQQKLLDLDELDHMGIRYEIYRTQLFAGKYNMLRNYLNNDYFDFCYKHDIPYQFDQCQIYAMLVVCSNYKQPQKFKDFYEMLSDEQKSVIINPNALYTHPVLNELAEFIKAADIEVNNHQLVVDYINSQNL